MPAGRHRKPFSNKQKKEQLQAKRERKRNKNDDDSTTSESENLDHADEKKSEREASKDGKVRQLNQQPTKNEANKSYNPNRFNLLFMRESQEELRKHKKEASKKLVHRDEQELEIEFESVYKPTSALDMPIRPPWNFELSKEQLEQQERNYFAKYLDRIFESYKHNELSYFEMNLETWRQLWRVLEISDIVLLIVDIRFPSLHFSPAFYEHCTRTLQKDVILVLNKIDLVPTSLVIAWKSFFEKKFPSLHILLFSSSKQIKQKRHKRAAKENNQDGSSSLDSEQQAAVKALAADIYTARAHRQLYECVREIVQNNVDLTSWSEMTEELLRKSTTEPDATTTTLENLTLEDTSAMHELLNSKGTRKRFENGFVTIGCCGFPNVGKSSLLNSLNGRKVVSVSRTPGHTKHLQTIFLTRTVRLCDCPGLVFPSLVCKPLQILAGIYPIAQLQEPYSAIRYLAERIPVVEMLKVKHPTLGQNETDKDIEWSPLDICEAWAIKRGYFTAKASRPDVYRAANELLRMALDGRLCLALRPKNYTNEKRMWSEHPETKRLDDVVEGVELLAKESSSLAKAKLDDYEDDEDDDNESENDAYKYFKGELTSNDEKEKKDETTSDENVEVAKNPYSMLSSND